MTEPRVLRVAEVVDETADARTIVFDADFPYAPGQFLTLRIPSDQCGSVARCYSLSSSPHQGGLPGITVKRTVDGYASNWVCDNVRAGSTIEVLPPSGIFTPKSLDADLLLFAGGSGITPILSILRSALCAGSGRIVLFYANRDESSVIFAAALRALAAANPERLTVFHWLESVQGLPTVAQLTELARPFATFDAFTCGPAPFMKAVTEALKSLGLPRERRHLERFASLGANPFELVAKVTDPDAGSAVVELELDGTRHTLDWPVETKLLDLLLDKGLAAPYSCREGACSACAYRLVSGEVKLLNNEVLDKDDLDEGIRLACQSLPVSEKVEISYE
ncbi:Phenylacetate-CoA oxygenase/reductase, PaaK subunit [Alloactinosynnema sp. L-07]|uniref:ferredoxin--NADP reductase n=1 Tax=Alloactinosynnema sp. L-07 TaxID=1653480 RepID=UPI00065EF2EB|nr:ferredoxin--NADP reductase [Alloactinosynnema sp. L-07]CRK59606.1 Phenylacetate-CoA oxygenase/reductase, PaaK subunit [Alloactinosynnema sp. L-07]